MPGSSGNRGWTSGIWFQVLSSRHHSCASRRAPGTGALGIASCQAKACRSKENTAVSSVFAEGETSMDAYFSFGQ